MHMRQLVMTRRIAEETNPEEAITGSAKSTGQTPFAIFQLKRGEKPTAVRCKTSDESFTVS